MAVKNGSRIIYTSDIINLPLIFGQICKNAIVNFALVRLNLLGRKFVKQEAYQSGEGRLHL